MKILTSAAIAALITGSAFDASAANGGGAWTMFAGGVPSGLTLEGGVGFSRAPRVGAQFGISDAFSIGGEFSLDYAAFSPDAAGNSVALQFQAASRIGWMQTDKLSIGSRVDIGIAVGVGTIKSAAMALEFGTAVLYQAVNNLWVGGLIDLPMIIYFDPSVGYIPILFGGAGEYAVNDNLHLGAKLAFGPTVGTGGASTGFGMEIMLFGTYRL